jgi:hypothetical protein
LNTAGESGRSNTTLYLLIVGQESPTQEEFALFSYLNIIVPVFTASRQSVDGVIEIVRRAQEGRQLLAYDRAPAAIVPLPSRFDSRTEYALSQQWLEEFAAKFGDLLRVMATEGRVRQRGA